MAKIQLLDSKPYTYEILDTYYKECEAEYTNGKDWTKFKRFFKNFAQKVFETNINILMGGVCFPLAYSEKKSYASISHSLYSITPFVLNEWHLNYKPKESKVKTQESSLKNRFVDFWCMSKNKEIEIWIEVKSIWFNIKAENFAESIIKIDNSKDKCNKTMGMIQQGLEQLDNIRAEIKNDKIADDTNFKVVLLNIPITVSKNVNCDDKKIDSAPKKVEKLLNDFIKRADFPIKNYKKSVLCAVLDLDPKDTKNKRKKESGVIYENEYTPYFALGAIVLE